MLTALSQHMVARCGDSDTVVAWWAASKAALVALRSH